ncbi:MAG: glucose-phosphatase [Acetobacteraceae bacterium]|jgi:HAD superfamily hydrolase (TIGR01509 family)|nr:glucose-phosphatase [Acetobacteraceae bacterium]
MRFACGLHAHSQDTQVTPVTDISLILFDLNGVLYRYDRDERIAYLASVTQRPPEAVKTAIWGSGFEDSGDAGALDADAYLRGFGVCLGYDLAEDEWVAAQRAAVTPIPATLALAGRVRAEVRCAVLTNNNLLVLRHFQKLYPEVAALVEDRACVSAEFGARKPDMIVYRSCLIRLGGEPAGTLFVDDSPANVAGARGAGLHGHDYVGPDELAEAFARFGVLQR